MLVLLELGKEICFVRVIIKIKVGKFWSMILFEEI